MGNVIQTSEVLAQVEELTIMRRILTQETLEALKSDSTKYTDRLKKINERKFQNVLVRGTNISRPSILTYASRSRLRVETLPAGFSMNVHNIRTKQGDLVIFPMQTIGISSEGTPIIGRPLDKKSYSIVHIPFEPNYEIHNPAGMKVDLAFSVDQDNLVTVNGMNPVNADEYALFDAIVCEFERQLEIKQ